MSADPSCVELDIATHVVADLNSWFKQNPNVRFTLLNKRLTEGQFAALVRICEVYAAIVDHAETAEAVADVHHALLQQTTVKTINILPSEDVLHCA